MGEHPPLLTPQGPGVPRARRPGFPRVEDSRTSRVPSSFPDSLGITPPFAVSASRPGSHHFFPRFDTGSSTGLPALVALVFPSASFPFLPFPCVQFSPVLSTSFLIPATQVFFSFQSLRACISAASPSLSPSFPFLASSSLRFLRSRCCSAFTSTDAPALSPISFQISVPPPRLRGSVFVARESRRSALAPLPRSGKVNRTVIGT